MANLTSATDSLLIKKSTSRLLKGIFAGLIFIVLGAVLLWQQDALSALGENFASIVKIATIATFALGALIVLIAILACAKAKRKQDAPAQIVEETANMVAEPVDNVQVEYDMAEQTYSFVNMGSYQSVEEKFDQISKMDKTQFVIYVARLFSRKGYQVKLTPVLDNYDVDMIVEKMGTTMAVGVILTNKVLCKEDIICIQQGCAHYQTSNAMALTNMYFDKTALEFAKANKMSLIDRNILAEDFMN